MKPIPEKGMIVNPWPFIGQGPPPPEEMKNALLGLVVDLTPVPDTSQGSLFTTDYTVTVFAVLNGLREKRWDNHSLMRAYHFWSRRYADAGLGAFDAMAVPRHAVNTDPALLPPKRSLPRRRSWRR